ncbi:MAG TPA: DNA-processing protein DprA [Acidobacteriota bacterium]|nr:DNA-processing protein DprA [Acidobacteriota bacterium]
MNISADTQSILLLTARFSRAEDREPRPLTPTEWGRFASWLKSQELRPEDLITKAPYKLLKGWQYERISLDRIERLLERGSALALAMDKWLRAGLWVVTRGDTEYPGRLKKRLGVRSPALFFGSGNRSILNKPGIAVVGSRNADDQDLDFSRQLGATAAAQGFSIVSGGARGVDSAAMLGALEVEGIAVGVVADSLLRKASSPKFRKYLQNGDLSLISPFFPEAGFNVGNAMARNKYIYCLSEAAVVVHSGTKGGTWGGAHETLKKGWVPVWVKETKDKAAGNSQIVNAGARWISDDIAELDLHSLSKVSAGASRGADLFTQAGAGDEVSLRTEAEELLVLSPGLSFFEFFLYKVGELCRGQSRGAEELAEALELDLAQLRFWANRASKEGRLKRLLNPIRYEWVASGDFPVPHPTFTPMPGFYQLFLLRMKELCGTQETSAEDVTKVLQVLRPQLNQWIKRSIEQGKLKRYIKPVRYEWIDQDAKQLDMFRTETPKEEGSAEPEG